MIGQELHHAFNKLLSALHREGDVGKPARPQPSADRNKNLERRVLLPKSSEKCKVGFILGESGDNAAVFDVGEGIVDAIQVRQVDLSRQENFILRENVRNHDWRGRFCAAERTVYRERESYREDGESNVRHGCLSFASPWAILASSLPGGTKILNRFSW